MGDPEADDPPSKTEGKARKISETRNRERNPLRRANGMSVEEHTERFSALGIGLLLLPLLATRWGLEADS